ncbi:hypothetical protein LJR029_002529 [Caballeronia sp. LjRoot29]|uniref:hypothetical protein n=1 Tax=Caballeronia sp. LjRoot29 TaxID=3342315 RepID=UPI003ECC4F1E
MSDGKNEMKTFTEAIIEALCDVRVKASDSLPWASFELFHAIKSAAVKPWIQRWSADSSVI